jgi:hypothetical protein
MQRSLTTGVLALTSSLFVLSACNPSTVQHGGGNGSNGNGNGVGGVGSGGGNGSGSGSGSGSGDGGASPNCGVQNFMLQKGTPDLLIVQDISGSMNWDENDQPNSQWNPDPNFKSKWDDMRPAIEDVVAKTSAIEWGLMMFPGVGQTGACGSPRAPDVDISTMSAAAIKMTLDNTTPDGSTPTAPTMDNAVKYLTKLSDGNAKYIMLATDGEPVACRSTDDVAEAVTAVTNAAKAGIHTFVVGIGNKLDAQSALNQMAAAGLEPNPKGGITTQYYPVASTSDLQMALTTITGAIASCNFALQTAPSSPDLVSIEANGMTIPRDPSHMNGWDYGTGNMSIIFYGAPCDALKSGKITDVKAIYGCPPIS